jgi:hypothetical protein
MHNAVKNRKLRKSDFSKKWAWKSIFIKIKMDIFKNVQFQKKTINNRPLFFYRTNNLYIK